jgi:hypothetical protein
MNTKIARVEETQVARPLHVLAPLIRKDLQEEKQIAERATMEIKQSIGNKLVEARGWGSYKETVAWCKECFGFGRDQMDAYIALSNTTSSLPGAPAFESIRQFQRDHLGQNRPTAGAVRRDWTAPVDDIAERARRELERIQEAELTRAQEREADQKLALRIIEIGYKVLAKELHPDKGGSRDAMTRLNRVRDRLKQHA